MGSKRLCRMQLLRCVGAPQSNERCERKTATMLQKQSHTRHPSAHLRHLLSTATAVPNIPKLTSVCCAASSFAASHSNQA